MACNYNYCITGTYCIITFIFFYFSLSSYHRCVQKLPYLPVVTSPCTIIKYRTLVRTIIISESPHSAFCRYVPCTTGVYGQQEVIFCNGNLYKQPSFFVCLTGGGGRSINQRCQDECIHHITFTQLFTQQTTHTCHSSTHSSLFANSVHIYLSL